MPLNPGKPFFRAISFDGIIQFFDIIFDEKQRFSDKHMAPIHKYCDWNQMHTLYLDKNLALFQYVIKVIEIAFLKG
jgi:hypothetical protein